MRRCASFVVSCSTGGGIVMKKIFIIGALVAVVAVAVIVIVVMWLNDNNSSMSVKIVSPVSGSSFTLFDGEATDPIKVVVAVNGNPANGPYRLIGRDAQLHTFKVEDVPMGTEKTFTFVLSIPGTGFFTAFLADGQGRSVESHVSYSVSAQ